MNGMMKSGFGLLCAAILCAASAARADVPPPDSCRTEGEVCHNAGDAYDKDGVCAKSTCSKGSASGQVTTYECLVCEQGTAPGAAGAATGTDTVVKDDGGCSVGVLGSEKGVATLMLGLGLVTLGFSRRRR